jgi:hypothetical protein
MTTREADRTLQRYLESARPVSFATLELHHLPGHDHAPVNVKFFAIEGFCPGVSSVDIHCEIFAKNVFAFVDGGQVDLTQPREIVDKFAHRSSLASVRLRAIARKLRQKPIKFGSGYQRPFADLHGSDFSTEFPIKERPA